MPEQGRRLIYGFDGWEVDLARRELRARGVPVPLGNRAFQIFAVLVQSAGELVTKNELMARVWPGVIVEENKLQVHISAIRKALGTDRGTVKTSFGRGYRLVGDWTLRKENSPVDPVALDPKWMPVQPFLTNVPAAGSELVGRDAAVRHLQEFLSDYRAITLTGPGGIGKTALALEFARSLSAAFHGDRWLLETIRAYALEKLAESGEIEQAARRSSEFFRDLVRPAMHGSQVQPTVDDMARYGREIDNVRAALDWSFSSAGDVEIGVVLTAGYASVWLGMSLVVECRQRIERALTCLKSESNVNSSLAMHLDISLVATLLDTMGSVERIKTVLVKALSAAEILGGAGALLQSLFALCLLYQHSGECREAQSTAERFERLALQIEDPALAPISCRLIGNALHYGGRQREAQRLFERKLDACAAPKYQRHMIWSSFDLSLLGQAALARVLWLRGFVDQGVAQAQASFEGAQATLHKPTLCWVIHYGAFPFALIMRDCVAAERAMAMLRDVATSPSEPFWTTLAQSMEGKLLIRRGEFGSGSILLRAALDTCQRTGWTICYPEFLGALAEGLAGLGQFTEALATIDRALASANRGGEVWYVAELLRVNGELLLRGTGDQSISAAERCFSEALEVAREHDALSWELRIALSFARLRVGQDRQDDARQLLAPVYGRFTEGFETPDLRSASAMLESLPSHHAGFGN